jgi:polyribonucleotide nucleotidyltransferase
MTERLSVKLGDAEMTFETGRIAKQAHGAVMVSYGETMVLTTVCATDPRPGIDFFPMPSNTARRAMPQDASPAITSAEKPAPVSGKPLYAV